MVVLISSVTSNILNVFEKRIYCNTYSGGQMGSDRQLMDAVRNGAISIIQSATSAQVEQIPKLALLATPYLFSDIKTCNDLLGGELLNFFSLITIARDCNCWPGTASVFDS